MPALRFDDGDVLKEAAAILAWLGAAHGSEGYARDGVLGRREAEALSYMTSEMHAGFGPHFAAERFAMSDGGRAEVKAAAFEALRGHYARLEATLTEAGNWYLGQRSFADAYLYVLVRWLEQTPIALAEHPALAAHPDRMEADEGVRLALRRQGMGPQGGG